MTPVVENNPTTWQWLRQNRVWHRIARADQAIALSDVFLSACLQPFLQQASSISAAQQKIQVSHLQMYRAVKKLEGLGLLVVAHAEHRRGKPIKYYRVIAQAFFVPFALTKAESFTRLYQNSSFQNDTRLIEALIAEFEETIHLSTHELGIRIFENSKNEPRMIYALGGAESELPGLMQQFLSPQHPALWSDWAELGLSRQDAKALQLEISQLVQKYHQKSRPKNQKKYLLRTALAPL
jgi:hypothetical protein